MSPRLTMATFYHHYTAEVHCYYVQKNWSKIGLPEETGEEYREMLRKTRRECRIMDRYYWITDSVDESMFCFYLVPITGVDHSRVVPPLHGWGWIGLNAALEYQPFSVILLPDRWLLRECGRDSVDLPANNFVYC